VSHNRFVWSGLDELRGWLRTLPASLAGEASDIVIAAAEGAKRDMHYPRRTGNLADHVFVTKAAAGIYGAGATVKNTAKHAGIFESGTQARHTDLGANRGAATAGHVFVPAVIRRRRWMWDQLQAMMIRHSLAVSGNA
jgi:hypothetical protein